MMTEPVQIDSSAEELPEIIIRPGRGVLALNLRELYQYRDLFRALTRRTLTIRYKQTLIGVAWAVLKPLATMLILTVVSEFFMNQKSDVPPKFLLIYAGVLPWQLFSICISQCTVSMVSSANVLSKVYFPRLMLPASVCMAALVDFALSFAIFSVLLIAYGYLPGIRFLLLPVLSLLALVAAFGIGLFFAVLNVRFRDVQFAVPFALQLGLFVSPIMYPLANVPESWLPVYSLNPMVAVIAGFQWAALGLETPPGLEILIPSLLVTSLSLILGLVTFRKYERTFADEI